MYARERSPSPIRCPAPLYVGVLGATESITKEICNDKVIEPLLASLTCAPSHFLLPTEGKSSIYLESWAETSGISCNSYSCEWARHGKRAKIWRDNRIIQESTIVVVFLNKKSNFYETTATRLAKKGYRVFTVSYGDYEMNELVYEQPESPRKKTSKREKKPANNTGPLEKYMKMH
jgi:hypothetical protein